MKRLCKILLVFVLTIFSYGAFAQDQTVKKGSVHKYVMSELNNATSSYQWNIEWFNGTSWVVAPAGDYEVWKDYFTQAGGVPVGSFEDSQSTIYIKWKKEGKKSSNNGYRIRTIEKSIAHDCYDVNVNEKIIEIDVVVNSLDVAVAAEIPACAQASANIMTYDVTISNHKVDDKWKFKYEVRTDNAGAGWSAWTAGTTDVVNNPGHPDHGFVVIEAAAGNDKYTLNLQLADNSLIKGTGDYSIEIKITDVRDAYNTPVDNLTGKEATVVFHKIPNTTSGISTDD